MWPVLAAPVRGRRGWQSVASCVPSTLGWVAPLRPTFEVRLLLPRPASSWPGTRAAIFHFATGLVGLKVIVNIHWCGVNEHHFGPQVSIFLKRHGYLQLEPYPPFTQRHPCLSPRRQVCGICHISPRSFLVAKSPNGYGVLSGNAWPQRGWVCRTVSCQDPVMVRAPSSAGMRWTPPKWLHVYLF